MRQYVCAYVMDPGWHPNAPSWNVGESAALSTTSLRVTTVSRCLLQRPRKQRFLRQLHMAISSAFTLAAPHVSHQRNTMNSREGKSMTLQKWRRGWDSNRRSMEPGTC